MTIASLLADLDLPGARLVGNADLPIRQPVNFEMIGEGLGADGLAWLKPGNEGRLPNHQPVALLICTEESKAQLPFNAPIKAWLLTDTPRRAYAAIIAAHFAKKREARVEPTAVIHPSARLGQEVYIGHYVVIEEGCTVGDRTHILHHTVLMENTQVGSDCHIGCNSTVGRPGFGYERDAQGRPRHVEQVGRVRIGNHVSIHSNSCIDRAAIGETVLEDYVGIDNLVHIAHGAHIGERTLVTANAMVAGSARIGPGGWIAPSVNILNGITLGANLMTGMGAVVVKPAGDNETLIGSPAEPIERFKIWQKIRKGLMGGI